MVAFDSEEQVRCIDLDILILSTIPANGIIITAPGKEVDFVSRYFSPQTGMDEDPATAVTHAHAGSLLVRKT